MMSNIEIKSMREMIVSIIHDLNKNTYTHDVSIHTHSANVSRFDLIRASELTEQEAKEYINDNNLHAVVGNSNQIIYKK